MGYTKTIIRGVTWISAFRLITRVFSFLKIIIIARILNPSQFGLFGIASLVLALLELITETGINVFLIQSKKGIHEFIDSAWVVSITRGILIFITMISMSSLIASFFKIAEARELIMLMSLVPLIRGFINPAEASFQKDLKFRYEFWFKSTIFIFDALIGIAAILILHNSYGLVVGVLSGAVLEVILSFTLISLKPRLAFDKKQVGEIIHSGKWITAYGILNYFSMKGDNIIVGRVFGVFSLGLYEMAYNIAILPISEISDVVNRVAFPIFVRIEQERERLFKAFKKTILAVTIPSFILSLIIFLFSEEIVLIVLGQKWESAIPILKLLAVYGFIRAIAGLATSLFLAIEKQKYVTMMNLAKVIVMFIFIFPLSMAYGINGVAYAVILSAIAEIPVIMYYIRQILKENNNT